MKVNINVDKDKYDVQIDSDDLWSLDFTLSKIIHLALIRFKEEETGYAPTDKEDVPEYLHTTYGSETDCAEAYSREAWIWVIDEMIWGFGQTANNQKDEPDFFGEDYKTYIARIANAHRLFGKYLSTLWN